MAKVCMALAYKQHVVSIRMPSPVKYLSEYTFRRVTLCHVLRKLGSLRMHEEQVALGHMI